jgi:outer membrane protein OmpA-like peptidoglycan-associated protein
MTGRLLTAALVTLAGMTAQPASAADCAELLSAAKQAEGNSISLRPLASAAQSECPMDTAQMIRDALAFALFNETFHVGAEDRRALLAEAASLSADWRIQTTFGEDLLRGGARAEAVAPFEAALRELNTIPADQRPAPDVIYQIVAMASTARALSETYQPLPRTRSGTGGGSAARSIAGVPIETLPFPIEFVFGTSELTESGRFALNDLVEIIRAERPDRITLAGHTDPVGSEVANRSLSEQRAARVATELTEAVGVATAQIETVGCGETSPPDIPSPEFYSEDERHQIMRRVVYVRSGNPCQ